MPKILFISPTIIGETPITIAMLSAVAKEEGFETASCINTFERPLEVEDFVNQAKGSDIVAISMMTFEILFVYKIIKALKKAGFPVIAGGTHPTSLPEEVLEAGADAIIIGEGEDGLREVLRAYPNIPKGIIERKPRLDTAVLPLPDLEVFDQDLFKSDDGLIKGFHRIYTSRGCPGHCTFCDWQVFRQKFSGYPVDVVINEMKRRRDEYGINSFTIADDCFTVDRDRAMRFCKKIKPLNMIWRANSRANLVDLELLKAMKDAGCHSMAFGIESGDPDTLRRTGKGVTLEENIAAPTMAHEAGLEVYCCLMTGFPWEIPKHIQSQIDYMYKVWDKVSLFTVSGSIIPFPGSAIYKIYNKEYGFTKFWLKPKYQGFGIQVYQNALNPLAVSTFYHRYFFDDIYILKEYFFRYTPEYKKAVRKMIVEIGRHNLRFMFKGHPVREKMAYLTGLASMKLFDINPNIEMKIGGYLYGKFHKGSGRSAIEKVRDKRRGFVKHKC